MASRTFVDLWEVFDGGWVSIGWVPEFGEFRAWADALESLSPQLKRNLWSLRTHGTGDRGPFGTPDSHCYALILRDDNAIEGTQIVIAYTKAVRAVAL